MEITWSERKKPFWPNQTPSLASILILFWVPTREIVGISQTHKPINLISSLMSFSLNFFQSIEILFCFVGLRKYALTNAKSDNMSTFEGDNMRFYATFCYLIVDRYFLINLYNSVCVSIWCYQVKAYQLEIVVNKFSRQKCVSIKRIAGIASDKHIAF